jgi:hypothetical protein
MLNAYIAERYPHYSHFDYAKLCQLAGLKVARYPYGLFTWSSEGDALIVHDLYTASTSRAKGYAWSLFYDIKKLARALDKTVIMGFSEHEGPMQEFGIGAMKAAGFKQAFDTPERSVWIRGVQ